MTAALVVYSSVFARYALAVTPKNYLLFGCHVVNFSAQSYQGYRFVDYWYRGGREKALAQKAETGVQKIAEQVENKVAAVAGK
jgi:mitochondrial pyruvate carrier 1